MLFRSPQVAPVNPTSEPPLAESEELPGEPVTRGESVGSPETSGGPGESSESLESSEPAEPALVLERRGSDLLFYAELSIEAARACGVDLEVGGPVVEVVAVSPAGGNPELRREQIPLELPLRAAQRMGGFRPADAIRAALGWSGSGGFVPLAVGRSLDELGRPEAGTLAERAEQAMGR